MTPNKNHNEKASSFHERFESVARDTQVVSIHEYDNLIIGVPKTERIARPENNYRHQLTCLFKLGDVENVEWQCRHLKDVGFECDRR